MYAYLETPRHENIEVEDQDRSFREAQADGSHDLRCKFALCRLVNSTSSPNRVSEPTFS